MLRQASAAALVLGALAVPAGGCSLILDFDDPVEPAAIDALSRPDGPDAAPPVDAPDDPFEPNDTADQATLIEPGTYEGLSIIPANDVDFFRFSLAAPSNVQIDVLFAQVNGDLDLYLYDEGTGLGIGSSLGWDDNEQIIKSDVEGGQIGPGTYRIRVASYGSMFTNQYTLVLTVF